MYSDLLRDSHERRLAYYKARQDFPGIDEELEASRERRRAADERALRDAEETTQGIMANAMRPAPVVQPARQDERISWGKELGQALGKVGAAFVTKKLADDTPEPPAVNVPLPQVDLTPPRPPSESPVLLPSSPELSLGDDEEERRRRDVPDYLRYLGMLGLGGTLRRPGDYALVGDDPEAGLPPTEIAVRLRGGDTAIIPVPGGGDARSLAQTPPDVRPPPPPQPTFEPPRPPSEPPVLIPSVRPEESNVQPVDDAARRRMALRPADSSDQLADVHEFTHRLPLEPRGAVERPRRFAPAPETGVPLPSAVARLRPQGSRDLPAVAELTARAQGVGLPLDARGGLLAVSPSPVPMIPPVSRSPSEFESLSVPVVGRPGERSRPAAGEEEANDARVRERLEAAGGFVEGGDSQTRARIARLRPYMEKRVAEIEANPTRENGNSRLVGALKMAGRGALQGFARTGTLAGAAGGAITGGVAGAVDKSLDERFGEQDAVARYRAALQSQYEREGAGLKLEDERAGVRQKNAQAAYYEARPDIEAAKREDARAKDERARVFRVLSSLKGQMLDPSDPRVMQLRADADRAGVPFDVESFNNSRGNVVRYTRTDPDHPERTVEVERNIVTGEETVLGQRGFQATRNSEGRTAAEVEADKDRDRGFNALERQRSVSNELQRAGLNLSRERFDFSKLERDDRLSEGTRKEMGAAAKMRSEAEQAQMDADSLRGAGMYKGDDGKERQSTRAAMAWKKADAKAEALRREYFATYGYLHEPPEGGEMKMTMDEFRQLFPNAPNPMASAPSYGVVITDSTQPGTPHTNNYPPRRPAPRAAGSTGRTYTEAEVRERARAQGKNEDEAVRAARAKNLIQ